MEPSSERYRRVQLDTIPSSLPRFDCPKAAASQELPIKVTYSERWAPQNLVLNLNLTGEQGGSVAQLKLELARQDGDAHQFNLSQVKEGKFEARIRLVSLFDIHNDLKGFERTCPIKIDRTPPLARLALRNGRETPVDGKPLRLGPGESIEVNADDATSTKVLSCWSQNTGVAVPCTDYVEAGNRLSAPNEGEWTLSYTVVDEAGNQTPVKSFDIAIFDADRVGRIVEWIELAKAHLKDDDNYEALQHIYRAARAMGELKAKSEWAVVRNKLRVPFLKLLPRLVPTRRIENEEGIVDKLWATSDTSFLAHSSGERRWGHIIKQYDLNGAMLKRMQFEDKSLLAFDVNKKKLLVWKPDNTMEIYDPDLKQETAFQVKVEDDSAEKLVRDFVNGHALVKKDGAWFHLDVAKGSETPLTDLAEDGRQAAISHSGKWLIHRSGDGIAIRDLASGTLTQKTWPIPVDELRFARFSDLLCLKAAKTLRCADPEGLIAETYVLDSKDAQGRFAIDGNGKRIGFEGTKQFYEMDLQNATFYFYPFLKKVLDLYYNNNSLRVYSPEGTEYVTSLPREPQEPKPFNPNFLPQRVEFWADNEQIYYDANSYHVGKYSVAFRSKDGGFKGYGTVLDPKKVKLSSLTLLPSRTHFLAITMDQQIEIYPIDATLLSKFAKACNYVSPSGESCVYEADGKAYFARLEDRRYFNIKKPIEIPGYHPAEMLFWHPTKAERFAGFDQNKLLIWDFSRGEARLAFQAEAPGNLYHVTWLSERWVAASGEDNYLAVWDTETKEKLFEAPRTYDYSSHFEAPIDFSPIPGVFAVVGKDDNGIPVLELWKKGMKEAYAQHVFPDPDMEWAQIMRFDEKSRLLLIGFHHGYVYVIKDVNEPLQQGNVTLLQSHEDIIMSLDFKGDGRTAYSISSDGSIVEHDLFGNYSSRQILKTRYSNSGGWLPDDQVYWMHDAERRLSFFDKTGKLLETAENLGDLSLNAARIAIGGSMQKNVVIDWNHFEVWRQLCEWAPGLLEFIPENAGHWKKCQ
jgi:WD40 repeat protein